jgi:hypothetical protein
MVLSAKKWRFLFDFLRNRRRNMKKKIERKRTVGIVGFDFFCASPSVDFGFFIVFFFFSDGKNDDFPLTFRRFFPPNPIPFFLRFADSFESAEKWQNARCVFRKTADAAFPGRAVSALLVFLGAF